MCCGRRVACKVAEPGKSPERNARLAALMARVALGDQAAFAELYRQSSSHLYGVAVRILKDGGLAEEILQEAFVSVWHHAGSYEAAKSQPSTWLAAIVRNRSLDLLRKRELDTVTMTADDDEGKGASIPVLDGAQGVERQRNEGEGGTHMQENRPVGFVLPQRLNPAQSFFSHVLMQGSK